MKIKSVLIINKDTIMHIHLEGHHLQVNFTHLIIVQLMDICHHLLHLIINILLHLIKLLHTHHLVFS